MIVIENDWLKVGIENKGAEVRKVEHKKNELDYMWTGDSAYWGRVSPVLFPIVGRLKGDQYQIDGQTYNLPQHGFLRDVEFDVDNHTTEQVSFVFNSAGRFLHIYPYEFKATIYYILNEDSLIVRWKIENDSKEEMYFSIGAHPAFRIPLLENEEIEDYRLEFTPAPNKTVLQYELKDALIHEKGTANDIASISLTASLFKNDAVIYSNIDSIILASNKSSHGVEVAFNNFPFVGIWSKYIETDGTMAPFVCIEPWYGIADTHDTSGNMKEKFGVNKLEVGKTFHTEYEMKFK
ncbi:aldose 1-epimerase family protein [Priestia filamentosa]|uniref:aldose 1-epimerase family protein n=1 Tax=Priestia filamentosa TaxID=1402861 RepID=UPI001FB487A6|nr:aldose 1-epimerase family protein [Priestia filamentosa]MED3729509.1 aldose 1-epimerase family protein [Priestia filamentosa]UOE62399.1 aldose 1-epimerase family protein [Priestia filamentosa]